MSSAIAPRLKNNFYSVFNCSWQLRHQTRLLGQRERPSSSDDGRYGPTDDLNHSHDDGFIFAHLRSMMEPLAGTSSPSRNTQAVPTYLYMEAYQLESYRLASEAD